MDTKKSGFQQQAGRNRSRNYLLNVDCEKTAKLWYTKTLNLEDRVLWEGAFEIFKSIN
jgi:hypothetical protein